MNSLIQALKQGVSGEVKIDAFTKRIYSVDASIYEIEPVAIVIPRTKQDIVHAVLTAKKWGVPVIARGAATGLAGGCIGKGIIIDTSKYLNKITSIDLNSKTATCEPGVVQDELNQALAPHGYRLGPDTSTGNRATIGGMAANNSSGAHSLYYGRMVDAVLSIEMVLSTGEILSFGPVPSEQWAKKCQSTSTEGQLYKALGGILETYREEISAHFPKLERRASGYNLDELIRPGPVNLAKIITGSEGTFGIITEVTLSLCPRPKYTGLCLLHGNDLINALRQVPSFLAFNPFSLEIIDAQIIALGRLSPAMRGKLSWLQGSPQALLVAEFKGETEVEVQSLLSAFKAAADAVPNSTFHISHSTTDPKEMHYVWELRKAGVGLLMSRRSYSRGIAFIEDTAVPPENLAQYFEKLTAYLTSHGKQAGIYGHAGAGCMHVRPFVDLRKPEEVELMVKMMDEVAGLVAENQGVLSGEHGDGLLRAWLIKKMFGEKLYQAMWEIKKAFDPDFLMNPGKILPAADANPREHLRIDPHTNQTTIKTFLDFSKEGGFELAVDMCNGNGQCRKKEGLMCPTFPVDGDEYHTTRARAQSLRAIVNGKLPIEEFTSKGLYDVLDLCVECKGCKTECPSQVDMAKMKAEFLYHYHQKHGTPLRSRLFAHVGTLGKLGSTFAPFSNWLGNSLVGKALRSLVGITSKRDLPTFTSERFSAWLKNTKNTFTSKKKVVLFNDTYNEYYSPHIGKAAVKVLNHFGYEAIVLPWTCCGRPFISKGLLEEARQHAKKTTETLLPFAKQGIPIVGLEPSCILTLQDDLTGILPGNDAQTVSAACIILDEFLYKLMQEHPFKPSKIAHLKEVHVHTHCHQKALVGSKSTLEVLKGIPGVTCSEINSGCCGLAGSFGYEKEHYDFSMKIGEDRLLPAVRKCADGATIIANGMSCRSQISHGTGKTAKHLAELLADLL